MLPLQTSSVLKDSLELLYAVTEDIYEVIADHRLFETYQTCNGVNEHTAEQRRDSDDDLLRFPFDADDEAFQLQSASVSSADSQLSVVNVLEKAKPSLDYLPESLC